MGTRRGKCRVQIIQFTGKFLKKLKAKGARKLIYCEKIWVYREDLPKFGEVRPMLVPFNLK